MPLDLAGLDGVIAAETVLSRVDGAAGILVIRGHRLEDIAGRLTFEHLAADLWRGFLSASPADLGIARAEVFNPLIPLLPHAATLPPVAAVRLLVAAGDDDPLHLVARVAVGLAAVVAIVVVVVRLIVG